MAEPMGMGLGHAVALLAAAVVAVPLFKRFANGYTEQQKGKTA